MSKWYHPRKHVPSHSKRNVPRPTRNHLTNKNKDVNGMLEANARLVTPGDVEPDGGIPVEDGGFRTDAPSCPQLAVISFGSLTVHKKPRMRTFDCKAVFLTDNTHDRDIYVKPPKAGLPGVHGSLVDVF